MVKHYETVFILTPVLSEEQMKDTVEKFKRILTEQGAEIYHEEHWGLRKLAYPIDKKNNGFYQVLHFKAPGEAIKVLETEYFRDERVIRHLVTALDKYAVAFFEKKRTRQSQPETPTEA